MLKFKKKLSLVVLSGALTLGLSPVVQADSLKMQWLPVSYKKANLDCPSACRKNPVTSVVMFKSLDKNNKPISICLTQKDKRGEWLVGYNRWEEKTCVIGVDGQEYQGTGRFYCLCTNNPGQPFR